VTLILYSEPLPTLPVLFQWMVMIQLALEWELNPRLGLPSTYLYNIAQGCSGGNAEVHQLRQLAAGFGHLFKFFSLAKSAWTWADSWCKQDLPTSPGEMPC